MLLRVDDQGRKLCMTPKKRKPGRPSQKKKFHITVNWKGEVYDMWRVAKDAESALILACNHLAAVLGYQRRSVLNTLLTESYRYQVREV